MSPRPSSLRKSPARGRARHAGPSRQRGAVAVMVSLSLLVLVGVFGLAVDSGQLYVNKAELQTAADACALAAAQELTCQAGTGGISSCPASFLQSAEAAGIYAAGRNKARMQSVAVSIAASDVRFASTLGPNSGYLPRNGGASPNARFAMCTARASGITPWLVGVLGIGPSSVSSTAVATLAPGQSFCGTVPIGVCRKPTGAAPDFGYAVGEWMSAAFDAAGNDKSDPTTISGSFKWVDFTPSAGGTNELSEQLYGRSPACGLRVGDNVKEPGSKQGVKFAYNARFGIYANAGGETALTAPPDRTGYAYPNQSPGSPVVTVGTSAYSDYVRRQALGNPFVNGEYNMSGTVTSGNDVISSSATHQTYGSDRRLVAMPVVDCTASTAPILAMACVLMLNPMNKGKNGTLYLEYRGNASDPASACRTLGGPAGTAGGGPLVPTLVQ